MSSHAGRQIVSPAMAARRFLPSLGRSLNLRRLRLLKSQEVRRVSPSRRYTRGTQIVTYARWLHDCWFIARSQSVLFAVSTRGIVSKVHTSTRHNENDQCNFATHRQGANVLYVNIRVRFSQFCSL